MDGEEHWVITFTTEWIREFAEGITVVKMEDKQVYR